MNGWECPKCHAVMSPFANVCVNCKGSQTLGKLSPKLFCPNCLSYLKEDSNECGCGAYNIRKEVKSGFIFESHWKHKKPE